MFSHTLERNSSAALDIAYHLAPWDAPIFAANTACITEIAIKRPCEAADAFGAFRDWCAQNRVVLISCRLAQHQLGEAGFLEGQGFRFIELNYRPKLVGLGGFADDAEIAIAEAGPADAAEIIGFAATIFQTGRLHADPQIGAEIGNRRYAAWAENAFHHPGQRVLKCVMQGRIAAFVVDEQPSQSSRFWSLVGLAPGLQGQGLGQRIWRAMLAYHHREGVEDVSTSISSHNMAAMNLYVSLGFRFPPPEITLHWCPNGPLSR